MFLILVLLQLQVQVLLLTFLFIYPLVTFWEQGRNPSAFIFDLSIVLKIKQQLL